jgi:hypothetical protein
VKAIQAAGRQMSAETAGAQTTVAG